MKGYLLFAAVAVANLIACAAVLGFLPPAVAVHLGAEGTVDRLVSPWAFVSMPVAAVLLAGAAPAGSLSAKGTTRIAVGSVCVALAAALISLGWYFTAFGMQSAAFGETVSVPYATFSALPLSLLLMWGGYAFPWFAGRRAGKTGRADAERRAREAGLVAIVAGGIAAAASVAFSCVTQPFRLDYVGFIFLAAAVVAAGAAILICRMRKSGT